MIEDEQKARYPLRGTVLQYIDPTKPVAEDDWEVLKPDASADPADRPRSPLDTARALPDDGGKAQAKIEA